MSEPTTLPSAPGAADTAGGHPGWPRPVLRCLADQDPFARRRGVAPAGGCKAARPVPWVSQIDASGTVWDPWIFDSRRAEAMVRLDLCQVCGLRRGATVYVLGAAPGGGTPSDQRGAMIGGALCSLRCARLTATACPHFSTRRPIEIHAVPKAAQRIRLSDAEFDIDEVYDLSGLVPLVVLDDSEPAAADLVTERRSGGPR